MIAYLIWLLVIGLIVGAVARFLVPGRDPMGCLATALLGIAGSFVGGLLFAVIFHQPGTSFVIRPSGLIGSVLGAIILLLLLRAVGGRRR